MALIISLSILGLLLILAEIVLIPGIFIAGSLGLISMAAACWFAFDGFGPDAGYITIAANALLAMVCTVLALRSKTWKKLSLHTEIDSRTDSRPEDKGITVGCHGTTVTRLAPMGKVLFGDTAVECSVRNGIIDPGQEVEVILIDDNKIFVQSK